MGLNTFSHTMSSYMYVLIHTVQTGQWCIRQDPRHRGGAYQRNHLLASQDAGDTQFTESATGQHRQER